MAIARAHERRKGASNCHDICIQTIVETWSGIIPYNENTLNSISTVKYVMEQ